MAKLKLIKIKCVPDDCSGQIEVQPIANNKNVGNPIEFQCGQTAKFPQNKNGGQKPSRINIPNNPDASIFLTLVDPESGEILFSGCEIRPCSDDTSETCKCTLTPTAAASTNCGVKVFYKIRGNFVPVTLLFSRNVFTLTIALVRAVVQFFIELVREIALYIRNVTFIVVDSIRDAFNLHEAGGISIDTEPDNDDNDIDSDEDEGIDGRPDDRPDDDVDEDNSVDNPPPTISSVSLTPKRSQTKD